MVLLASVKADRGRFWRWPMGFAHLGPEHAELMVRHCGSEPFDPLQMSTEGALDLLEAAKDRVFVAPGLAILYAMLNEAEAFGITRAKAESMGYQVEWEAALASLSAMHRRGVRVLPGGDYGFMWNPHGANARDLTYFVELLVSNGDRHQVGIGKIPVVTRFFFVPLRVRQFANVVPAARLFGNVAEL